MKSLFLGALVFFVSSCGSNNDCPAGVNTTNPNCPNYSPYSQTQYPNNSQQPCQPGTPNCVNGYYQAPYGNQYPQQTCQPGTPNCVNGYYQAPYGNQYPQQTCQPGTPNCVNGYYQAPYGNQYPYGSNPGAPRYY